MIAPEEKQKEAVSNAKIRAFETASFLIVCGYDINSAANSIDKAVNLCYNVDKAKRRGYYESEKICSG